MSLGSVKLGLGLITIVKILVSPVQIVPPLVNIGVTLIVADTGRIPVLIPLKDGIFPFPLVPIPMEEFVFVQV